MSAVNSKRIVSGKEMYLGHDGIYSWEKGDTCKALERVISIIQRIVIYSYNKMRYFRKELGLRISQQILISWGP